MIIVIVIIIIIVVVIVIIQTVSATNKFFLLNCDKTCVILVQLKYKYAAAWMKIYI